MRSYSLSVLLHFAVHPPVLLFGDEQDDDVAFVEAEQRAVVAGGVGEDGAHARLLHDVVEARGYRHGPGEVVLLGSLMIWQRGREEV